VHKEREALEEQTLDGEASQGTCSALANLDGLPIAKCNCHWLSDSGLQKHGQKQKQWQKGDGYYSGIHLEDKGRGRMDRQTSFCFPPLCFAPFPVARTHSHTQGKALRRKWLNLKPLDSITSFGRITPGIPFCIQPAHKPNWKPTKCWPIRVFHSRKID